jgi:5'-3' exonuclease
MAKLLIIDGHNLLFQMFFGMPSRILNKDGKAIHGTLGFVGGLVNIIKMVEPTHMIVIFDRDKGNERIAINSDYKANRIDYSAVSEENNPFTQLPDIFRALEDMKIKYAEINGFEADDVAASYAIGYHSRLPIIISSYDSDFFQLLNDNIRVLRYKGKNTIIFDTGLFYEKYGIDPCYFADYKALVGDHADNIKGIEKIGPKTAMKLINEHGGVSCILDRISSMECSAVQTSLQKNAERLLQNLQLIKLDGKAPLPYPLEELQYDGTGLSKTIEILKRIGLK